MGIRAKNVYFRLLGEEFALLEKAVFRCGEAPGIPCAEACRKKHYTVCRRLIRDFITPVEREDLYRISAAVYAAVETFSRLSDRLSRRETELLGTVFRRVDAEPFRFDTFSVLRMEEVDSFGDRFSALSPEAQTCFSALRNVGYRLLEASVKNA